MDHRANLIVINNINITDKATEVKPHKPLVIGGMPTFPKAFQVVAIVDAFWHVFRSLNPIKLHNQIQGMIPGTKFDAIKEQNAWISMN